MFAHRCFFDILQPIGGLRSPKEKPATLNGRGLFALEPAMSKNDRVREMLGWKLKNK
jgi:hypothetical protein